MFVSLWQATSTYKIGVMKLDSINALKTLSGALHYDLTRYNRNDFSPASYDWEKLRTSLQIPETCCYHLEISNEGFVLTTRYFKYQYWHHDFHYSRRIQITG